MSQINKRYAIETENLELFSTSEKYSIHEVQHFRHSKKHDIALLSKLLYWQNVVVKDSLSNTYLIPYYKYLPRIKRHECSLLHWYKSFLILLLNVPIYTMPTMREYRYDLGKILGINSELHLKNILAIESWVFALSLVRSQSDRVDIQLPSLKTLCDILGPMIEYNHPYYALNILSRHYNIPFIFVDHSAIKIAIKPSHALYGDISLYLVDHHIPIFYYDGKKVYTYNFLIRVPPLYNQLTLDRYNNTITYTYAKVAEIDGGYFGAGPILRRFPKNYIYIPGDDILYFNVQCTINQGTRSEEIIPYAQIPWNHVIKTGMYASNQRFNDLFTPDDRVYELQLKPNPANDPNIEAENLNAKFKKNTGSVVSTYLQVLVNQTMCTLDAHGIARNGINWGNLYRWYEQEKKAIQDAKDAKKRDK